MKGIFGAIAGLFFIKTEQRVRIVREIRVTKKYDLADIERRLNAPVKGVAPVRDDEGRLVSPASALARDDEGRPIAPEQGAREEIPFARPTREDFCPTGILSECEGLNVEERTAAER